MTSWLMQPRLNQDTTEFFRANRAALLTPPALANRLAELDTLHRFRRIYQMGCGRSGTWLLMAAFATLGDIEIVAEERPMEDLGLIVTNEKALLLKRDYVSYQRIEQLPDSVEVAFIVRHPFAVLTSAHPATQRQRKYHISTDRWLGETLALQYLVDTARPGTAVLRYEDLVTDPDAFQKSLSEKFALPIRHPMSEAHKVFKGPPDAVSAMHGLRPIDGKSLEKYRDDPEKIAYLRSIRPRLGRLLSWTGEQFGYDVSL
jgi:hypothetical protein